MDLRRGLPYLARLTGPLDRSLGRLANASATSVEVARLRWFWLDSLFANISVSFFSGFVPLFALAYGATNVQIGQMAGVASVFGLLALLPGARAIQWVGGRRKALVVASGGILVRSLLVVWFILPFFAHDPGFAIGVIIVVNALIAFGNHFATPGWTAIVADIIPASIRGRYFSHRNLAVTLPALLIVPLAGWLIEAGHLPTAPFAGYQIVFALAFVTGNLATIAFAKIDDPAPLDQARPQVRWREAARVVWAAPGFVGLVLSTLIWNLGTQINAPFMSLYLVTDLGASTAMVGGIAAAGSLTMLLTQRWQGAWVDRRGSIWMQALFSFLIPWLPLAWLAATAAWQVAVINAFGGVLWAGYNLASFNVLLELAPEKVRAEAVALFQLVVALGAGIAPVIGGYVADAFGYGPVLVIGGALRMIGAVAFLFWVARRMRPPAPADSFIADPVSASDGKTP